jgi:hypothetical protein
MLWSKKKSKFHLPDNRPLGVRMKDFFSSLLFWKGRKKGMVYTMDIKLDHIRVIFFPRGFYETYSYLGCVPSSDELTPIHGLVMAMDAAAKPWWCPRWFLRFLNLFGNDNSIVRVRNITLHKLFNRITRGIQFHDLKCKWSSYDLRISISAPKYLQDIATSIEDLTFKVGRRKELLEKIKSYQKDFDKPFMSTRDLQIHLESIEQS